MDRVVWELGSNLCKIEAKGVTESRRNVAK